jgi:integral membrane protein
MFETPLKRFRIVSISEGISYILLLLVAMPMKYLLGIAMAVKITGWVHGALFVIFIITLLEAMLKQKWSIVKAALFFIASLIPLGAFFIEYRFLSKEEDKGL